MYPRVTIVRLGSSWRFPRGRTGSGYFVTSGRSRPVLCVLLEEYLAGAPSRTVRRFRNRDAPDVAWPMASWRSWAAIHGLSGQDPAFSRLRSEHGFFISPIASKCFGSDHSTSISKGDHDLGETVSTRSYEYPASSSWTSLECSIHKAALDGNPP